uniref:Glycerol-3-phosphate regulon repressor n=1 Tax=Escherichia coli TaxID=562 RepID=Q47236_ECOLX|nr:glycerol-3-phosphate regulon repressor [Escherichia coli]CAA30399.1 unnamed protein product [Escherichia coli K-12]
MARRCLSISAPRRKRYDALLNHSNLRIVTNNLNVANTLMVKEDFRIILAGGELRSRHGRSLANGRSILSPSSAVDFGILGISGIDSDGSLLEFDYHEVRTKRAIIENSRHVMLVVDHSKFGRNAMVNMGSISMVDAVYTDAAAASKRDAGADGPPYSTGAVLILHGFPRQTKTRQVFASAMRVIDAGFALARNVKKLASGCGKRLCLAADSDNVFQLHTVEEIDVFCLCAHERRKRGGAALLPVIAQTVYLIFNHVQSDASASGKGGHRVTLAESSRKLPRHVAWGEVAKANQAAALRC